MFLVLTAEAPAMVSRGIATPRMELKPFRNWTYLNPPPYSEDSVYATFHSLQGPQVTLLQPDGARLQVPIIELCDEDVRLIDRMSMLNDAAAGMDGDASAPLAQLCSTSVVRDPTNAKRKRVGDAEDGQGKRLCRGGVCEDVEGAEGDR